MQFIDSHCHLQMIDYEALGSTLKSVLAQAESQGVSQFICVATELSQHTTLLEIADAHPAVFLSSGLHPNDCLSQKPDYEMLESQVSHPSVVAVGETGLDYYRDPTAMQRQAQQTWFEAHIQVAKAYQKPLIIHTRQAREETIQILKPHQGLVSGVLHCFTEDWSMAKQALDLGLYLSFSGIITFKNAEDLRMVVKKMPLERILIETDAPFLAPVPYRGKINQPAYVTEVAKMVSEIKQLPLDIVAEQSTNNARRLFQI